MHSPGVMSVSCAALSWAMCVDPVMSTVAGPCRPVTVTVPPDTPPTSPYTRSLPLSPLPLLPPVPGMGLAAADGDAEVLVADVAEVGADDVLDWPHAANESTANPARVTTA